MRLNGDRCFDRWVRLVSDEFEISEAEIVDVFDGLIQFQLRQRPAIARKLLACLVKVIVVQVQITKRVNKITRF